MTAEKLGHHPPQHQCRWPPPPQTGHDPLWRCETCGQIHALRGRRYEPASDVDPLAAEAMRTLAEWSAEDCGWGEGHRHTSPLFDRFLSVEAGVDLARRVSEALTYVAGVNPDDHWPCRYTIRYTVEGYRRVLNAHSTPHRARGCERCCDVRHTYHVPWPCRPLLHVAALYDPADTDWHETAESRPHRSTHRHCGGDVYTREPGPVGAGEIRGCGTCGRRDQPTEVAAP